MFIFMRSLAPIPSFETLLNRHTKDERNEFLLNLEKRTQITRTRSPYPDEIRTRMAGSKSCMIERYTMGVIFVESRLEIPGRKFSITLGDTRY